MNRRNFIFGLSAAALAWLPRRAHAADAQQQVFDLFTKIAGALSDDDPAMFIEAVDSNMPQFADFRRDLVALTDLADLTNSIEILTDKGDDTHRTEELDWFLEIVGKSDPHPVERRRQVVTFRLERRGKKWKIVSIDRPHFFGPPKIS